MTPATSDPSRSEPSNASRCHLSFGKNLALKQTSRKRCRSEGCHFARNNQSNTTTIAATINTTSATKMTCPRGKAYWKFVLATLLLVVKSISCSKSDDMKLTSHGYTGHVPQHAYSTRHQSEAIWEVLDDQEIASTGNRNILPLQTTSMDAPSLSLQWAHTSLMEQLPPLSSSTMRKRSLQIERELERRRKDHDVTDLPVPSTTVDRHRVLIICEQDRSKEDCRSKLFTMYDEGSQKEHGNIRGVHHSRRKIEVIHYLEAIHALSVEVDSETLASLYVDQEFVIYRDFLREPLVLQGSMRVYDPWKASGNRMLQDQQETQEIPWGVRAIQAPEVWQEYGVRGEGVKICILDTGVQASHEDFRQSNLDGYYGNEFVSPHWYEDTKGHGTHITGTITASDNSIGVVGIAPEAETFIVRVFDDNKDIYGFADGTTFSTDLIAAATICKEWGADIINASLGGKNYNEIEERFFQDLFYNSGILTVAAAGNGGDAQNMYPAAYEGVISVGAADESLILANFSTWNPTTTDVLAPGVDILSTLRGNQYATFSGSSMAAPHVTGAFALMMSYIKKYGKTANSDDIVSVLKETMISTDNSTVDRYEPSNDADATIGVIDVYSAIRFLSDSDRRATEGRSTLIFGSKDYSRCANEFHLDVSTDSNGNEIYYRLKRLSDNQIIWMTYPDTLNDNSEYSETSCLEAAGDCYQFAIGDKGGDGISEEGGITISYQGNELYRGGDFGYGGFIEFGDCNSDEEP